MIRKRHEGDAWIVFNELANSTGGNVSRHADAAALGIWPSRGYTLHGFEVKCSRSDVQKELASPRKADAIGKFCDHWWLVVSEMKIIDGLVIPDTWGILAPKRGVLRVERQAPKLEAAPFSRGFVAAMIRNVCKSWVPRTEFDALRAKQRDELLAELARDAQWKRDDAEAERDRLRAQIDEFERASGVHLSHYQCGRIGEAVRLVLDVRHQLGEDALARHISNLEGSARNYEHMASMARQAIENLRTLQHPEEQQELPLEIPKRAGLHS
jgi:hypothetical protein